MLERLRTLGYPTVATYVLDENDVEGLDLDDPEGADEDEGVEDDEVPEGIKALKKRIEDWCKAMVSRIRSLWCSLPQSLS